MPLKNLELRLFMNKILILCLFLFSFSNNFSQDKSNLNTDKKLFTVTGLVVSKSDQSLLSKAAVKLQKHTTNPLDLRNNEIQSLTTDENGRWTIKNLAAGEYKITVSPPKLSVKNNNVDKNKPSKLAAVTKTLKITDENISDFVIELPAESTISGKIIVKGDQAQDFTYIIATDERQEIVSGSEIEKNAFRIENLSEGNYFLNLTIDNDYYVQSIKLGNEDVTNSTVSLKDGEQIKNVQITVTNDVGSVKGKIEGFEPDEGTLIVLLPFKYTAKNSLRSSMPEMPDENGEFEIKSAPGEYFVAIVTQENMMARDKNNLEAWFNEVTRNAQKVIIESNKTTNVNLSLQK